MADNQIPRHFAIVKGEEVVVAGYNKSMNSCLIVRLSNLPGDEAEMLRRIAASTTAQNMDYLVPTLRVEMHKSGQDWFTYIITRLQRSDGSVLNMPLKEMERMNEPQKAFYKGYGDGVEPTGGPSTRVGTDNEFRVPLTDVTGNIVAEERMAPAQPPANLEQARASGVVPTPSTDADMARVVAQEVGTTPGVDPVQAAMLEALQNINSTLEKQGEALAKLKPARATRKKRTVKKAPAAESAA